MEREHGAATDNSSFAVLQTLSLPVQTYINTLITIQRSENELPRPQWKALHASAQQQIDQLMRNPAYIDEIYQYSLVRTAEMEKEKKREGDIYP